MSFVDEVHVRLPSTWSASNAGQSAQTVSVDVGAERDKVEAAFMRTMTEVHVLRIQNAKMWNLFAVKRQSVLVHEAGADNAQAIHRFDGTDQDTAQKIIAQGAGCFMPLN